MPVSNAQEGGMSREGYAAYVSLSTVTPVTVPSVLPVILDIPTLMVFAICV